MQNNEGETPFHIIYNNNNKELFVLFLKRKDLQINLQNIDGDSVLHLACKNNDLESVKLLLSYTNIDINVKDAILMFLKCFYFLV